MRVVYGCLPTLVAMLGESPTLSGASVLFGEENVYAQDFPAPMVTVVPTSGTWLPPGIPGYIKGGNPDLNNIWMTQESVDLYLWAIADDPDAKELDHASAVEDLRAAVLQALQNQAPNGLMFRPIAGAWQSFNKQQNREGRAYKLTVQVDISIPDVPIVDATITKETIIKTLTTGS